MNKLEYLHIISKYLARFSEQVKILNHAGDFSINKISEDILIELLNKAYNLELVNANYSERGNYPAIDLIDYKNKIAFQVTATTDLQKIKESLVKFYTHELYLNVDQLFVYILTEKQDSYSQKSIDIVINSECTKHKRAKLSFDTKKNILDKRDLLKRFYEFEQIDRLAFVTNYLQKNFEKLVLEDDLSDYYEKLKNLFYEVVFEDESGMTLKDIYVDPSYSIYEKNVIDVTGMERPENHSHFLKPKQVDSLNSFLLDFLNGKNDNTLKPTNARCLVLLGYPGQGKTSCLKRLLNHYLTSDNLNRKDIFYFKLKNIRQGKLLVESPLSVLFEEASTEAGIEINKSTFKQSILLLDGLDELFMKENMTLDDIEKICKEISREVERNPNMVVIITSRKGYVELNKLQKENCLFIQIDLFDVNKQISWAVNFKKFHSNSWLTKEKLIEFNEPRNHNYSYLRELISQPILLQIIASLNSEVDSDSTRAQIYSNLFTELIERKYSRDGQLENFYNITKDDLRLLIQEIAFLIYKSGDGYISQRDLLQAASISEYLTKFPNKDFSNNIKGVLISFYFREHTQNDNGEETAIEFLHKSLQEYMTAEKIDRTLFEDLLDTNKKGTYIKSSYESALEVLNNLFGYQPISWEIKDYIIGLLRSRDKDEKDELYFTRGKLVSFCYQRIGT